MRTLTLLGEGEGHINNSERKRQVVVEFSGVIDLVHVWMLTTRNSGDPVFDQCIPALIGGNGRVEEIYQIISTSTNTGSRTKS